MMRLCVCGRDDGYDIRCVMGFSTAHHYKWELIDYGPYSLSSYCQSDAALPLAKP